MNGTVHGIHLYHAWNTSLSCLEYACTTHGICLEHASYMHKMCIFSCMKFRHQSIHVTCMSPYLQNVPNPCMLHACFRNHASNMQEISSYMHLHVIVLLEISYMKLSGFGCMKCAETCMKHACFRRSISSSVRLTRSLGYYSQLSD